MTVSLYYVAVWVNDSLKQQGEKTPPSGKNQKRKKKKKKRMT